MQARQYDEDEIRCAVYYQIIRHPVRVYPSEKVYELKSLLELCQTNMPLRCPLTRKPIYAIGYDTELKNYLDEHYPNDEDRHANYQPTYTMLKLHFHMKSQPIYAGISNIQKMLPSLLTGGGLFCLLKLVDLYSLTYSNRNSECFLYALGLGCGDFVLRYKTNFTTGLITPLVKAIQYLDCCPAEAENDDPLDMMELRI